MAANKKLSQHSLRKAMHELKKKNENVKKIVSPLAKYTEAGQLMCVVCKTIVRSEAVWPVHLNSKNHKEKLVETKKNLVCEVNSPKPPKSLKTIINDFKRPISPTKEEQPVKKIKTTPTNPEPIAITLELKSTLPEGFYDDPILDAKVRNVEYKDPVEEEWDKFLKEIKEETAQSVQIIADDQEEATTERQLDEIDEQISHWSRVMDLVRIKEKIQSVPKKNNSVDEDEDDDDEDDDGKEYDFLDWRVKNSSK